MKRPFAAVLCVVLLAAACAPRTGAAADLRVVTSTSLITDLVRNVAGDRAVVEALAPAGVSVEDYSPRPEDARKVSGARLLFINGLGLDRWAEPLLRNAREDARTVVLAAELPVLGRDDDHEDEDHDDEDEEHDEDGHEDENRHDEDEHGNQEGNPHLFLDVAYAKLYVERIRDALIEVDPEGREGYAARAGEYLRALDSLDTEIRQKVAALPPERRKLVSTHDSFPYFAAAYGFEVVGFIHVEPGREPSAAELAHLVERVRAERVPAVFAEEALSPRLAEALAAEAGTARVVIIPLTDNLAEPPLDSYVALMRHLVDVIVDALR